VHPGGDHARRVAADHLDGVSRVLGVDRLARVPAAPGRHAAVLLRRPSASARRPAGRRRAAAGATGPRLPSRHRRTPADRAPAPAVALDDAVLDHHRRSDARRRYTRPVESLSISATSENINTGRLTERNEERSTSAETGVLSQRFRASAELLEMT